MPLSPALAEWLDKQGHDAVHASSVGLHCSADAEIMTRARQEKRIIVTADLDYPRLLALSEASEPSLILFRRGDWSEADVVARMSRILQAFSSVDLEQSIVVVDRDRLRRRRLPIGNSARE